MASFSAPNKVVSSGQPQEQANYTPALIALTVLFFMMGFITCLNDTLIPTLKNAFNLNYTQAMFVQTAYFMAYLFMSIPSGKIIQRLGSKRSMTLGFVGAGLGCMLFYPAAVSHLYPLFLVALFILATGITLLQVAANPYVAVLGSPESASSRLTLTQAFGSLGTTLAPFFGSAFILSGIIKADKGLSLTAEQIEANLHVIKAPYIGIAITLFAIAIIVSLLKLPAIVNEDTKSVQQEGSTAKKSAFSYPHLLLGALGIFAYVGAEVSIGSFLIGYIGEPYIMGLSAEEAARYVIYYWGGSMTGRFIGSAVLKRFQTTHVLGFNAMMAICLVLLSILSGGGLAMGLMLAVGFFNSLMFPSIFTLALAELGKHTTQGSGILCTAIVGGALVPALQGTLADSTGLRIAFILPVICYAYIAWYALKGSAIRN
jgi:MFS transporter, FHS family, L-fucose permease